MASRDIADLDPAMQPLARKFLERCKAAGIDVLIYCTLRSVAEQAELYKQGRTKPGDIVTNARGGESWHNFGRAFDFVPLVGGKPSWGDKELYRRCGEIAESLGMEWAGRWTGKLKETAHVQFTGGKSLAALRAAAGVSL